MQTHEFHAQAQAFLILLFKDMAEHKIDIPEHWKIDHLCYRVASQSQYEKLKNEFANLGRLLVESEVNGRPIATYKLHQPILHLGSVIDVVELPAPKPGKVTEEGFEHIEIVCDVPFTELEKRYGHLKLDRGGMKKEINPELEICLGPRNLKFHHRSLEEVIAMELGSIAKT